MLIELLPTKGTASRKNEGGRKVTLLLSAAMVRTENVWDKIPRIMVGLVFSGVQNRAGMCYILMLHGCQRLRGRKI
ncbi:MAG TPA: hypothetical protein VIK40_06820 [Geomonas sp.]